MAELRFDRGDGALRWDGHKYLARSGPHGKGALPAGRYTVLIRGVVEGKGLGAGYRNTETGNAWFIPLAPRFETSRSGFGIHPDGNVAGTLGCIGLVGEDASAFWARWNDTPLKNRPCELIVS